MNVAEARLYVLLELGNLRFLAHVGNENLRFRTLVIGELAGFLQLRLVASDQGKLCARPAECQRHLPPQAPARPGHHSGLAFQKFSVHGAFPPLVRYAKARVYKQETGLPATGSKRSTRLICSQRLITSPNRSHSVPSNRAS